ncbi:MAG: GNAT family protein [Verrucomicrobiales bacterium]|nr:GNAT family protein [Verrucomicrobiales bacterium]
MDYLIAPECIACDGFILRSYRPGDGGLLSEAVNDSYEHLAPLMPWAKPQQSVEESEKLVREFRARYLLAEDFVIGIFNTDQTRLLGGTGFHLREGPLATKSAEIGMFIRKSEAGKGLGTEALKAMLTWGFDAWPWIRLAWICDSRNKASIRTAEKAGMEKEGLRRGQAAEVGDGRRDTVLFGALRDNWAE